MKLYIDKTTILHTKMPVYLSVIIYILSVGAFLLMLEGLFLLMMPLNDGISMKIMFISQMVMVFAVFAATAFVLQVVDRLPFSIMGLSIRGRGYDIFYGLATALAIYAIGFSFTAGLGFVVIDGFSFDLWTLFYSFIFFFAVAISEEVMCRGYILGRMLQANVNRFLALFLSSLVFALLHMFNPNITVLSFINILIAGCMMGVVYLYTRNLWFPISLHLFWNWIQGPILGYEVSGMELMPSFIQLSLPSNNMWNGGMFGFEGSIVCTVLMLIFIAGIIIYFQNKVKRENSQAALEK